MYCVYSLPFAAARDENGSAISHTASLRENSVRSGNGFSSSRRQSVTRLEMSLDSRPDCDWMFCTHSFSPLSIANTSALVEMAVSGVLSSWLAFVMNCFCAAKLRRYGAMARPENNTTSANTRRRLPPATASVMKSSDRMVLISISAPICRSFFRRKPMYVQMTSISDSESSPQILSIRCSEENTCRGFRRNSSMS